LLCVRVPLVAASAFVLFLAPGLLLSLALNAARDEARWLLHSLALSLVLVSATAGGVQALAGVPIRGPAFGVAVMGCMGLCLIFPALRLRRGDRLAWPLSAPFAVPTALSLLAVPLLFLILLAPKFHWENFNGDGIHAYETARLLLFQQFPFFPGEVSDLAAFPTLTSVLFAFPASWFIRLFGELEAAVRLPFLLYLGALYAVILALVEQGARRVPGVPERGLIWLGLAIFVIVMSFSATYNPYAADIALPGTQDTLAMVCFLGFVLAFISRQAGWILLFGLLTFLSSPGGLTLIGLWLLATVLTWRPRPWRSIALGVTAILFCLSLAALAPSVLAGLGLPRPGREYGSMALLSRLRFVQLSDWHRLAYMALPCGILPAAGLLAWPWQGRTARALTVITLGYFTLFYVQAYVVLHHFVPTMVLPLVVFWRLRVWDRAKWRPYLLAITGVAGVVALVVSLPASFSPDTSARAVGMALEDRLPGYDAGDARALRHADILLHLFPYDFDELVPENGYGGSPHAWHHYAHRTGARDVNYVMQEPGAPPPPGMRLVAEEQAVALFLKSEETWLRHRAMRPPTPAGSPLYVIPRWVLFRRPAPPGGPHIWDLKAILYSPGQS
jgi:hypothetical protein